MSPGISQTIDINLITNNLLFLILLVDAFISAMAAIIMGSENFIGLILLVYYIFALGY
jgi:hypothetical protein